MSYLQNENKKLGIKDFTLMGIFGAIIFVLAMLLMMIAGATPVTYLFYPTLFALLAAPFYLLVVAKVRKFGAFLIPSAIMGILLGILGAQSLLITSIVFGLLAELIVLSSKYTDFKRISIAYIVLSLGFYAGDIAPMYAFTDWYIKQATGGVSGTDMTYINALIDAAKSWLGMASLLTCIVGAVLGVLLAKRILRKHFEKAGLI